MTQNLSRFAPIVVFAAAVLAAVLISQPWEEATAGNIQYRVCDFVIEASTPQQKGDVRVNQVIEQGMEPSLELEVLGEDVSVSIDATSDTVVEALAVPDVKLQPVLDTLRIEPLNPSTAPWPYTKTVQRPPIYQEEGILRYQLPDPGSGLVVTKTSAYMTDGSIVRIIELANCRSVMEKMVVFRKGEEPKVTDLTDDVRSDDQAAFRTFFDELDIHEPEGL